MGRWEPSDTQPGEGWVEDKIRSKLPNQKYRDNYDRIFANARAFTDEVKSWKKEKHTPVSKNEARRIDRWSGVQRKKVLTVKTDD